MRLGPYLSSLRRRMVAVNCGSAFYLPTAWLTGLGYFGLTVMFLSLGPLGS